MTNEEAKFRLQAYRPGGADAQDPQLAEALAQAERDPALRAWAERAQAFDAIVAGKLREVAPPAGLREAVLAGTRVSAARGSDAPRWWRRSAVLALAATFAVLLAAAVTLLPQLRGGAALDTPEALARFARQDLGPGHPPGVRADQMGDVGAWFQDPANRLLAGVPFDVATLKQARCRVVTVGGQEVFELCFRRGTWFHVYVTPRRPSAPPPAGAPVLHEENRLATAAWADADYVYVLASSAGVEAVKALL